MLTFVHSPHATVKRVDSSYVQGKSVCKLVYAMAWYDGLPTGTSNPSNFKIYVLVKNNLV